MLSFFDTKSDRLATWSHRQQARRLLGALTAPDRMFDAIVVGDTRITMSASQFDDVVRLCLFHGVELWCPEIGYAYEHGNVHHAAIMWQLFWGRHDPLLPRQRSAGAPLPVGDPPNS